MNIAYMMGTSTSSALEALYGEKKKQDQENKNGVHSWQADTVEISEAARALLERVGKDFASNGSEDPLPKEMTDEEQNKAALEKRAEEEAARLAAAGAQVPGGPDGPAGGGSPFENSGMSTEAIDKQIEGLTKKLMEVQGGSLPEATKSAMVSSILDQINQLLQQKREMTTSAGKQAA